MCIELITTYEDCCCCCICTYECCCCCTYDLQHSVASFIACLTLLFSLIVDLLNCRNVLLPCQLVCISLSCCFSFRCSCTRYLLYQYVFSTRFAFCLFSCCILYLFKGLPGTRCALFFQLKSSFVMYIYIIFCVCLFLLFLPVYCVDESS